MASHRTLPLYATLATLAGALAAAACLVATGAADAAPARAALPSSTTETDMSLLRTFTDLLARFAPQTTAPRADRLDMLDARALRDLGLDASEIASVESEHRGTAAPSRLRVRAAGRHG